MPEVVLQALDDLYQQETSHFSELKQEDLEEKRTATTGDVQPVEPGEGARRCPLGL